MGFGKMTTVWDAYLVIIGVVVLIGYIAYKLDLFVLGVLFLGFLVSMLASACR